MDTTTVRKEWTNCPPSRPLVVIEDVAKLREFSVTKIAPALHGSEPRARWPSFLLFSLLSCFEKIN
jgi:hypothetical protein